jgi:hypothetical protein
VSHESQCQQVLKWLRRHRGISSWQAIQSMRCTRLAARIAELRQRGHRIVSETVRTNGKRVSVYRLQS